MSEYLRAAVTGKSLPPSVSDHTHKPKPTPPRAKKASDRSGPGYNPPPAETMAPVDEGSWPPSLRTLLIRERQRMIDLFRHWEGSEADGGISAEHFKAGLFVLGYRVLRSDVDTLYAAMGVPEGGNLTFNELRRQLRVVTQKGCSAYLRSASRQGLELEAAAPRGSVVSGVATLEPQPSDDVQSALLLSPAPNSSANVVDGISGRSSIGSRSGSRGGIQGGIACSSSVLGDDSVALGADASSGKERALAAATEAALALQHGSQSLISSEMWVQQWSRGHYSTLLPELRKWEVYPDGLITFEVWADSLHALGFPAAGRWSELESVFYSWEPDELGRLHWQTVRARMTGGRLVRVHGTRRTTAQYYAQASRAGEGFGNRSASRFKSSSTSFVGPGKYTPGLTAKSVRPVGRHSGSLKSTAPRFLSKPASAAPGPGKYTPKHTLQDGRTEIPMS